MREKAEAAPSNGRTIVRTLVCLQPELTRELDAQAAREGGFSRSAIIRKACLEYLARQSQAASW